MKVTKQLRKRMFGSMNRLLAGLLSLPGFYGCDINESISEYGTPHADYTVKGRVLDKSTGKPVKGIRVGYSPNPVAIPEYGVIGTEYLQW